MSIFPPDLIELAEKTLAHARGNNTRIVTAESCTGGLIAALLTEIPGSSDVMLGSHITYANEAKQEWLGVEEAVLNEFGAVSEEVARAMAEGMWNDGRKLTGGEGDLLAVAVTGVAGPGGGSAEKPVGTVHLALYDGSDIKHFKKHYAGSRSEIRLQAARDSLLLLKAG